MLAAMLAGAHPALADKNEPEICHRAKALGYDEGKELLQFSSKRELCTRRFWYLFRPKPLAQILDKDEQKEYHTATEQGDCKRAASLLSKRFDAAHPDAPRHLSDSAHQFHWRGAMTLHYYDSLGLCDDLRFLQVALKDIDAAGLKPRPFWNWRKNYFGAQTKFPRPVQQMYSAVARLLRNMGRTQSPKVALAVLRISNEGRALKLHPHYEVYIAHRLRALGVSDPLLDELINRPLDAQVSASIREKIRRKEPSGLPTFPEE